jgi:hypothetical protein
MSEEKVMRDFEGTPINIGDEVIYIKRTYTQSAELRRGKVTGFKRGNCQLGTELFKTVAPYNTYKVGDGNKEEA